MASRTQADILHHGKHPDGRILTSAEREVLLHPYLPQPRSSELSLHRSTSSSSLLRSRGVSTVNIKDAISNSKQQLPYRIAASQSLWKFFCLLIYKTVFLMVQVVFSAYIRLRRTYHAILYRIFAILYHHHRTPELIKRDVRKLGRRPNHLSIILNYEVVEGRDGSKPERLRKLLDDLAEVSAWCACAGIPVLSVYERSGILKSHIPSVHRSISSTLCAYFPPSNIPGFHLRAPNMPNFSPPSSPTFTKPPEFPVLSIVLLSASDGRDTLVDLTKTLAEMSQREKLHPWDITPELIDAQITESSCGEPDLLILWGPPKCRGRSYSIHESHLGSRAIVETGPDVCLQGYPPWQVRLTEIFFAQDNRGVSYQVFLRALYSYAKAQMRFGR